MVLEELGFTETKPLMGKGVAYIKSYPSDKDLKSVIESLRNKELREVFIYLKNMTAYVIYWDRKKNNLYMYKPGLKNIVEVKEENLVSETEKLREKITQLVVFP